MATRHDDYDEDRRLREMGIFTDDPIDIMRQVEARYRAMRKRQAEEADREKKAAVDRAESPR